jgi:hypothetical protein
MAELPAGLRCCARRQADRAIGQRCGGVLVTNGSSNLCRWCERPFQSRRGGSPQRFCGARCRTAFWSALRRWGERAIAAGILTVADVRDGDGEACTLLPRATLPVPIDDDAARRSPTPIAPRAENRYTPQENLERLMAQAIAAARRR